MTPRTVALPVHVLEPKGLRFIDGIPADVATGPPGAVRARGSAP